MRAPAIVPCVWFDSQAEEAAAFYARTLPEGRVLAVSRYPGTGENPAKRPPGSVLTVEFSLAGRRFTALNGGPMFVPNPSLSFFVEVATADEAARLFAALEEGGTALMPLDAYSWSPCFGWVQDRFGVSWQVMTVPGRATARIVPCFMFAGPQAGRAEAALRRWVECFPSSGVEHAERYAASEGPAEFLKQGRFTLAGQPFAALDSHLAQGISFNEALSLHVLCVDQPELDAYWESLSAGGSKGPCGWVKDAFGFSWQVAPEQAAGWLASDDAAARDRVFASMMGMSKLDLAVLERAFVGASAGARP